MRTLHICPEITKRAHLTTIGTASLILTFPRLSFRVYIHHKFILFGKAPNLDTIHTLVIFLSLSVCLICYRCYTYKKWRDTMSIGTIGHEPEKRFVLKQSVTK